MIIRFENLTYSYKRKGLPALTDISGAVGPGLHLLLGENGAGKTTLLHLIAGLRFPSSGTCTVDGCPTRLRLPSISSHIFFTGINMFFPAVTLNEMASIHGRFYPRFSVEKLRENLAAFGLTADMKLRSLSTGSYQKAKIAYALALAPDILLLDEPANGLDIQSKRILHQMIASQMLPEQTVIVSTHTVNDLETLFDGVIDLSRGHMLYALTVDEITARVRFTVTSDLPSDAIYFEPRIGRFHCIRPNLNGEYSEPDYQLLYMAARNPKCASTLVSLLNMPEYEKR